MPSELEAILKDAAEINADCRLIARAIRGGWLSPEKRDALQRVTFSLAGQMAGEGRIKEYHALAKLLESGYQFDVKLAEREESRERKYGFQSQTPAKSRPVVTGVSLEQRKLELAERIRGSVAAGADGGGS